jgi:hypothetical protein
MLQNGDDGCDSNPTQTWTTGWGSSDKEPKSKNGALKTSIQKEARRSPVQIIAKTHKMNLVSNITSSPSSPRPNKLPTKNTKARTLKAQAAEEIEV